jgi:hypothetical protein
MLDPLSLTQKTQNGICPIITIIGEHHDPAEAEREMVRKPLN